MNEGKSKEFLLHRVRELETRCGALEEELERLQENKKKYQRLIENLKEEYFFYTHDTGGVFTYVSPSIQNVLGHSQEDFLTHFTRYLTDNPVNQKARDYTQGSIRGIQQPPYEVEILHADGSARRLEVTEVPIFNPEGEVVSVEGIAHDITGRYRAEKKLKAAQETLETRVRDRTAQLISANEQLQRQIEERKRVEEALRLAETRYRSIFENAVEGIFQSTLDGTFIGANPALARIYGYDSPADLIQNLTDIGKQLYVHPKKRAEFLRAITERGVVKGFENEIRRRDGSLVVTSLNARSVRDTEGKIVYLEGTVEDITLRKKAEEALKDSETRYRTLVENLPVGIYRCTPGPEGGFLMANEAFLKMFGFESMDQLRSAKVSDLYVDPSQRKEFSDELLSIGSVIMTDRQLKKRDGTPMWGTVTARVSTGQGGETVFDCVIEDITSRKMAEHALLQSEARYRFLVENTFDGFFIAEYPSGRFIFLNQPVCDLFGYSLDEGVNKSIWDVIDPADHELIKSRLRAKTDGEIPVNARQTYTGIRKDGSRIRAEVSASVVEFQRDLVIQGVLRDITTQEQLQRQLQQAQKMEAIGTLAGGIAHDFNNILGAVVGYTELAAMDLVQGSQAHRNLQDVLKACRRARDLVKQILAFSRQSGQERVPLHLATVAKEALKLLRSSLPTTIEIKTSIQSDLQPVLADGTQIHQVIMNLCANSAHAMEERGGLLEVDLRNVVINPSDPDLGVELAPGPYVRLMISDTGQGIEPAFLEKVFDPYFTTKPPGKGTGLGLAVVHGIVKRHGGHIRFLSQPGKGTTVEVFVPVVEAEAIELKEDSGPLPTGKGRVLFVDDEVMLATLGASMLSRLGFEVEARTDPLEAIETFRERPASFDLVITDMTMPNMTGDVLALEMMRIRVDIPIIICTGFSERMNEDKAKSLGIKGFIMKPMVLKALAETVQRALDKNIL